MQALKRVRVERDLIVRIQRNLDGEGKIFVQIGQEVTPDEIIGRGEYSAGFRTLNLSNLLEISPQDIEKYLKKPLGLRIYKGELLAYKKGSLFKKERFVVCPIDGILDFINKKTGEVRITRLPQKQDLPAGVYGIVEDIQKDLGQITIRTQVSKVFGVCGSGRVRAGTLHIHKGRSDIFGKDDISSKYEGSILLNGSLISKESILRAISSGINGIITGGIDCADYKAVAGGRLTFPKKLENDIGISLVVCEGFGSQAIGEDIFEILSTYQGKFVQLDGNHATINLPSFKSSSMLKIRKTKLPPSQTLFYAEPQVVEVSEGQTVRVIGSSYASEQGKIVGIDRSYTTLPSKLKAYLLVVETKRRKIKVPSTNIEVVA